jgi:hypothetical protein
MNIKKGHIKYVVIKKPSATGIKICADCKRKKEKKNENK